MLDFTNKNVLITGASRGIGRATAIAFARRGARIGINYKSNKKAAEETLSQLPGSGHRLMQQDIATPDGPRQLIQNFVDAYDRLDILVNNAGIFTPHPIAEVPFDEWLNAWGDTLQTNLIAAAHLCYWASQEMINSGGGRIINVSSRGAFRGEPDQPAYGASKAGLNALTQSLAKALAPYKIYVTAVAPGFTDTDMGLSALSPGEKEKLLQETPFQRMAKPEEVAHAILYLASDGAEYASGTIIDVNGASYLRS